jgi:hypothetical protein
MEVVIDIIVFLAASSENHVDPDTAVAQLEAIASQLRLLSEDEMSAFLALADETARAEEAGFGKTQRFYLLHSLGESMGLR